MLPDGIHLKLSTRNSNAEFMVWRTNCVFLLSLLGSTANAQEYTHFSTVLNETRNYRVFLPADYNEATAKRYPVIYFFHGFGERFNQPSAEVGDYDFGYAGDNLSRYAATHDVIIVKPDGFNPRWPGEERKRPYNECPYDPTPDDCEPGDTHRDFPLYFLELTKYIDGHYRTLADRDHRAVSGVSIGGWMAYFLAWLYPDRIGSASSFMGSPEFQIGGKGFATEWSPTYQYANFEGQRTRLVIGTKDFIRWYHREMDKVWKYARSDHEVEEFPATHSTPAIAKTLDFHMRAFSNPLPKPAVWTHADLYPRFQVWGYTVSSPEKREGFVTLANVSGTGFRASGAAAMSIETDARYVPGARYHIRDGAEPYTLVADHNGRLHFSLTAGTHEIGITRKQEPIVAVAGWRILSPSLPMSGGTLRIAIQFINKGTAAAKDSVVRIGPASAMVPPLRPGETGEAEVDLTIADPEREILRLDVRGSAVYIPLVPQAGVLSGVMLSDGMRRPMWKHATQKTSAVLGAGNGDGLASPGESIAFQILDGDAYRGGEVLAADPCLTFEAPVRDQWGTYDHVGATQKYSVLRVTDSCRPGRDISVYVRFVLPRAPEHILRQGVYQFRISEPPKRSAAWGDTEVPAGSAK